MFIQNTKFKKIISIFLISSFLIPSLLLIQPKKVNADTVFDPAQTVVGIFNSIKSGISAGFDKISSAAAWINTNKETVLDGLAWTAAKLVIRQMTTSIVNWINSGFEGSPAFVTDFTGMMTDIADQVIGEYIDGTKLAFLCGPFSLQVKLALWNTFYADDAPTCTLSDIIKNAGGALQSLQDDFRWGTWLEMTSNESNNVYGAFLKVESSILNKIAEKQDEEKREMDWGEGFMSWKECEDLTYFEGGVEVVYDSKCTTQTPGSVIEAKLNHTLGLGEDSLVTADEINEILGALLMQLAKSVMSSAGLLGQDVSSYGDSQNIDSMANTIIQTINDSLEFEREYNEIKNDSLRLIMTAKKLLLQLIDCLTITGETEKLDLANKLLTETIIFSQPPLNINLKELEDRLHDEILISDKIILDLNTLIKRAGDTTSSNELNDIMTEYSTLAKEVSDLVDISDAEIERDGYEQKIEGLPNGLDYDIRILYYNLVLPINNGDFDVYPPEQNKGLNQRYEECQLCKSGGVCTVEGNEVR